jgi:hypothetical protein
MNLAAVVRAAGSSGTSRCALKVCAGAEPKLSFESAVFPK